MTVSRGQLPQAFSASRLCVPSAVRLEGEWLLWAESKQSGLVAGRAVEPDGLLDYFSRIKTANGVFRVAQRYGPLGLCEHGHPISHADLPAGGLIYDPKEAVENVAEVVTVPSPRAFYCSPARPGKVGFGERIDRWLYLAEAMRAVLNVAETLKKAKRPRPDDLTCLFKQIVTDPDPTAPKPTAFYEQMSPKVGVSELAQAYGRDGVGLSELEGVRIDGLRSNTWILVLELLNKWLLACPIKAHFTFTDSRRHDLRDVPDSLKKPPSPGRVDFEMSFMAGDRRGFFPALVFDLIGRVRAVGSEWMVSCAHCDGPAWPRGEPREGRRVFCPACRAAGWPQRYALRTYYNEHSDKILNRRKERRLRQKESTKTRRG
jgi:hypothetical protein